MWKHSTGTAKAQQNNISPNWLQSPIATGTRILLQVLIFETQFAHGGEWGVELISPHLRIFLSFFHIAFFANPFFSTFCTEIRSLQFPAIFRLFTLIKEIMHPRHLDIAQPRFEVGLRDSGREDDAEKNSRKTVT